MYLCNNESKWETQGEIQALLIYFYRIAWHWALICDVDNEIVRNRDVYIGIFAICQKQNWEHIVILY